MTQKKKSKPAPKKTSTKKSSKPAVSSSSSSEETKPVAKTPSETAEMKFSRAAQLVEWICQGKVNGVAMFGERGLGKSYTIKKVLEKYSQTRTIKKIKGKISPLQVYNTLYENNDQDCVVWFDDCDSAFTDNDAMNILKAAMDTDEPREVCWNSNSKLVAVPDFRFRGRVIVSTNVKLAQSEHLAAFLDRMHWCSMFLSQAEKLARIEDISKKFDIDQNVAVEVVSWIKDNVDKIGDQLSLRTFAKVADYAKLTPDWKEFSMVMIEEARQVEVKDIEVIGAKATSNGNGKSTNKGDFQGYAKGTRKQVVYDILCDGKPHTIQELAKKLGKKSDKLQLALELVAKGGKKYGWSLVVKNQVATLTAK